MGRDRHPSRKEQHWIQTACMCADRGTWANGGLRRLPAAQLLLNKSQGTGTWRKLAYPGASEDGE